MITQSGRLATWRDKIKLLDIGYRNVYGYKTLQGGYIHPGVPFHKIKKSLLLQGVTRSLEIEAVISLLSQCLSLLNLTLW